MSTYYMNEGAFEVPDGGFVDRTLHVLEATHPEHGEVSLVVKRTPFPEGSTLRKLVEARIEEERRRLSGYSVTDQREATWAGVPVLEVASRWRHEGGVMYQRQAHLALGATWMYFALSAPFAQRDAVDGWLHQIGESIRLRGD